MQLGKEVPPRGDGKESLGHELHDELHVERFGDVEFAAVMPDDGAEVSREVGVRIDVVVGMDRPARVR